MLSDDELAAIWERAEAATPGPWHAWDRGVGWHIALDETTPRPERLLPEGERTDIRREEDAEFIAHAREDVPALLEENVRLHTWPGLMSVLAEHYPPDVFDGSSGDLVAQILVLTREVDRLRGQVAELEAQRDKVLALHTEFDGRCTECVEYCDCLGDECTHGSVEWPCPTAAVYAEPAPAEPTAEKQARDEADLADINRRVAAEQNVLDKAKAWRAALPWQTGVPRDKYTERLADTQDALCMAVDGLPADSHVAPTNSQEWEQTRCRCPWDIISGRRMRNDPDCELHTEAAAAGHNLMDVTDGVLRGPGGKRL